MGPPANQPSSMGLAGEIGEAAQLLTSADEQALDRSGDLARTRADDVQCTEGGEGGGPGAGLVNARAALAR